jgi:HAD superfamily hydrolase (TIGR01450 family)
MKKYLSAAANPQVGSTVFDPIAPLLGGVEALLLDLDGVLYLSGEPLPQAAEFMAYLRASGRRFMAVTNNARATPACYEGKLAGMGIELPAERILTAGTALAEYLRREEPRPAVHVVGSAVLRRTLRDAGIEESERPDCVIVGIDPAVTVEQLGRAVRHILAGARVLATNADRLIPTRDGYEPECGAVAAFIEYATQRPITVIGKPNPFIFRLALERLGADPARALMVGDTLDTDIAGAKAAGLRSVLLETGSPIPPEHPAQPTLRLAGLAELIRELRAGE